MDGVLVHKHPCDSAAHTLRNIALGYTELRLRAAVLGDRAGKSLQLTHILKTNQLSTQIQHFFFFLRYRQHTSHSLNKKILKTK